MNSVEEKQFAWALIDAAASFLSSASRSWLCVKIGAGEQRQAIVELLAGFVTNGTELPPALAPSLWAWINGFLGSASEPRLRDLASRIRLSNSAIRRDVTPEQVRPVRLVAKRADRATVRRAALLRTAGPHMRPLRAAEDATA